MKRPTSPKIDERSRCANHPTGSHDLSGSKRADESYLQYRIYCATQQWQGEAKIPRWMEAVMLQKEVDGRAIERVALELQTDCYLIRMPFAQLLDSHVYLFC